jgi:phage-related protein
MVWIIDDLYEWVREKINNVIEFANGIVNKVNEIIRKFNTVAGWVDDLKSQVYNTIANQISNIQSKFSSLTQDIIGRARRIATDVANSAVDHVWTAVEDLRRRLNDIPAGISFTIQDVLNRVDATYQALIRGLTDRVGWLEEKVRTLEQAPSIPSNVLGWVLGAIERAW